MNYCHRKAFLCSTVYHEAVFQDILKILGKDYNKKTSPSQVHCSSNEGTVTYIFINRKVCLCVSIYL